MTGFSSQETLFIFLDNANTSLLWMHIITLAHVFSILELPWTRFLGDFPNKYTQLERFCLFRPPCCFFPEMHRFNWSPAHTAGSLDCGRLVTSWSDASRDKNNMADETESFKFCVFIGKVSPKTSPGKFKNTENMCYCNNVHSQQRSVWKTLTYGTKYGLGVLTKESFKLAGYLIAKLGKLTNDSFKAKIIYTYKKFINEKFSKIAISIVCAV